MTSTSNPARPEGRRTVSSGVLRVAPLMPIPALLREAAIDPDEVLSEFGLTTAYFEDPENIIPFTTGGRILNRCVERTGLAHFGLLVGQRGGLSTLGTVGYLMRSAPDVGTALRMLAGFLHIHDGGAVVTLDVEDGYAMLGYSILTGGVDGTDQILDTAMAVGANLLRELCGRDWRLVAVHFSHAAPRIIQPYRQALGVTPAFDAEATRLVFAEQCLDLALASADPVLHRLMAERVTEVATGVAQDVVGRLNRLLRPVVGTPECTLEVVSKRLGMPARTLNRQLAAQGTTFRALREEVRLEAACQLLSYTSKAAYQVAETLGFSAASAFTRAFRRRYGMGPAAWREQAALGRPPRAAEQVPPPT